MGIGGVGGRGGGGALRIPEFAPTEHPFAVFLHSFVVALLRVAHQLPVFIQEAAIIILSYLPTSTSGIVGNYQWVQSSWIPSRVH